MICEHASSVMVQAVLTTRLSSRWHQQESGHRLSSSLPWRAEEPCGGRACRWLGKWPPACSCGYSILPSIPHLPPEGLGRAASSNNTVQRATPPRDMVPGLALLGGWEVRSSGCKIKQWGTFISGFEPCFLWAEIGLHCLCQEEL